MTDIDIEKVYEEHPFLKKLDKNDCVKLFSEIIILLISKPNNEDKFDNSILGAIKIVIDHLQK